MGLPGEVGQRVHDLHWAWSIIALWRTGRGLRMVHKGARMDMIKKEFRDELSVGIPRIVLYCTIPYYVCYYRTTFHHPLCLLYKYYSIYSTLQSNCTKALLAA